MKAMRFLIALVFAAVCFAQSGSYIGVGLQDIDGNRAAALKLPDERGVEVVRVQDNSPADRAGIKTGDVLLTYNGEAILGAQQLGRLVAETPPNRHVKIGLFRENKTQTITVVTEPAAAHQIATAPWGFPSFRSFAITDVPTPVIAWKNQLLGVECEPVEGPLAASFGVKQGLLVRSVDDDSAAYKAGLRAGDVISGVGDHPIDSARDLTASIQDNRRVNLSVMRNHKLLTMSIPVSPGQ